MPAVAERKLDCSSVEACYNLWLVIMCRLCKGKKNRNIKSKNNQTHSNPVTRNNDIITVESMGFVFPQVYIE